MFIPQSVIPGPRGAQLGGRGPPSRGVTVPLEDPASTTAPPLEPEELEVPDEPELEEVDELELVELDVDVPLDVPLDEALAVSVASAAPSTGRGADPPGGSSLRPQWASAMTLSVAGRKAR